MSKMNIGQAKAQFSALIKQAEAGGEVIILRAGKPVVKLVAADKPKRIFGIDDHLGYTAEELDVALPAEIVESFYQ